MTIKSNNIKKLIDGNKLSIDEINELLPFEIALDKIIKPQSNSTNLTYELSSREKEIAQLITSGLKNREISNHLKITYETVKTHRKNIFRKLQINHVSQLIHLEL